MKYHCLFPIVDHLEGRMAPLAGQRGADRLEVTGRGPEDTNSSMALGDIAGVTIKADAGGVRPTFAHLVKHVDKERPEAWPKRFISEMEPDDPAHQMAVRYLSSSQELTILCQSWNSSRFNPA